MSKAPCFFYEGAYTQVCDRLKKIWQRRAWQKDAGEANVIAYENKGTLATLMLSGTIFAFGSTIASTATAGVGALVMSAEIAASPELTSTEKYERGPIHIKPSLKAPTQRHSFNGKRLRNDLIGTTLRI